MTEEKPEAFDFDNVFDRLKSMTNKPCGECGQEFRGLEEQELCTECSYKRDHPEEQDMHWTWSRAGRGRWRIVAHWPDKEPLPNPGDRVSVHRKDGSSSTAVILEVELRYLPTGRAQLRCMIE